ncbi:MAG TPA: response regulator [Candidatus Omnitrophota bacterium]|nr:response regulator [Candidatus Omnitrophota bacterium]
MITILLCDDDPNVSDAVITYLKWHGYEAAHVRSMTEAEAFLKKSPADLLICSIFLPLRPGEADCGDLLSLVERLEGLKSKRMKILLIGPEQPEDEEWRILRKKKFYFLLKYACMEKWLEKIRVIAGGTDGVPAR